MAVGTPHIALLDFGFDLADATAVCHHPAYRTLLFRWIAVVKLKYANIILAAVNAGVFEQVAPDPHAGADLTVVVLGPLSAHAQGQRDQRHDSGRNVLCSPRRFFQRPKTPLFVPVPDHAGHDEGVGG